MIIPVTLYDSERRRSDVSDITIGSSVADDGRFVATAYLHVNRLMSGKGVEFCKSPELKRADSILGVPNKSLPVWRTLCGMIALTSAEGDIVKWDGFHEGVAHFLVGDQRIGLGLPLNTLRPFQCPELIEQIKGHFKESIRSVISDTLEFVSFTDSVGALIDRDTLWPTLISPDRQVSIREFPAAEIFSNISSSFCRGPYFSSYFLSKTLDGKPDYVIKVSPNNVLQGGFGLARDTVDYGWWLLDAMDAVKKFIAAESVKSPDDVAFIVNRLISKPLALFDKTQFNDESRVAQARAELTRDMELYREFKRNV